MATTRSAKRRDWYKISFDTVRGWVIFLTLLAVAVGGFLVVRHLEQLFVRREAVTAIEEARQLSQRVESAGGLDTLRPEFDDAWKSLERARTYFGNGELYGALAQARRSRALFASILDALNQQGGAGEAQFIDVEGGVDYRRGDHGDWQPARSRVVLRSNDYVKTADNGSAEIMFFDGTLYTVRPNTLFLVSSNKTDSQGSPQAIRMEYGWVNLNTAQNESKVATPEAEAKVARQSEAVVAFDKESKLGHFMAYHGGLEVVSKSGEKKTLGSFQEIRQVGTALSAPKPLPPAPQPMAPKDNLAVALAPGAKVVLRWAPLQGATGYDLEVSRNRLFVDNLIDVSKRRKNEATLGVQGTGSFLWRVAAVGNDGTRGPWSDPRVFRVVDRSGGNRGMKHKPPTLVIDEVRAYGNIFILSGHTDPGADVTLNGEQVTVEADGSFTKTFQARQDGWSFVEIKAHDAWGDETVRRRRVYVESL